MVSDVESVVTGPQELGEYDDTDDIEVEPQVDVLEIWGKDGWPQA